MSKLVIARIVSIIRQHSIRPVESNCDTTRPTTMSDTRLNCSPESEAGCGVATVRVLIPIRRAITIEEPPICTVIDDFPLIVIARSYGPCCCVDHGVENKGVISGYLPYYEVYCELSSLSVAFN